MDRIKTLKDYINEYVPGIEKYGINYKPKGESSLLGKAVLFAIDIPSLFEGQSELAYKLIDVLIENGADPASKLGGPTSLSAIEFADRHRGDDGGKLYNYLMNKGLSYNGTSQASATEADWKGIGKKIGNVIKNGVKNGLKGLGKTAIAPGRMAGQIAKGITRGSQTKEVDKANLESNQEIDKIAARIPNWLKNVRGDKAHLDEEGNEYTKEGTYWSIAFKMAKDDPNFFESDLYKVLESVENNPVKLSANDLNLLFNKLYKDSLSKALVDMGLDGLEQNADNRNKQLKIIVYCLTKNISLNPLRDPTGWKPIGEMEQALKDSNQGNKGKFILIKYLRSRGIKVSSIDRVTLTRCLQLLGYGDKSKINKVISDHLTQFEAILEKSYDNTPLSSSGNRLKEDISKIFKDSEPKVNDNPTGLEIVQSEIGREKVTTSDLAKFFEDNNILKEAQARAFIYRKGEQVRDLLRKKYPKVLAHDNPKLKFIKEIKNALMKKSTRVNPKQSIDGESKVSTGVKKAQDEAAYTLENSFGYTKSEAQNMVKGINSKDSQDIILQVLRGKR